jgi:hypothetical protein
MYSITATVAEAIQPNERTFQRKQYTVHYKLFFNYIAKIRKNRKQKPITLLLLRHSSEVLFVQ